MKVGLMEKVTTISLQGANSLVFCYLSSGTTVSSWVSYKRQISESFLACRGPGLVIMILTVIVITVVQIKCTLA